jgi:phosphonate transport system substrate-binding protein
MGRSVATMVLLACLCGMLGACDRETEVTGPRMGTTPQTGREVAVYRLAIHPLHNPAKLIQAYQPLVDYLNGRLQGAQLVLEASRDYANFEEKYQGRKPELLLPNPWHTLQAMKQGYHVIAMAGDPHDFKGIFVVRRDSGLKKPADLKGKTVSYPSPTALAACIMPQYFLHRHGIDVNRDIINHYVGSQESAIMNSYLKLSAAGVTWPPPWRAFQKDYPREAAELTVIWETEPLVNNSIMVRDDLPVAVADQVRELLLRLDGTTAGTAILGGMETARFRPATDRDYDVVRRYVARFEREVRPVEKK